MSTFKLQTLLIATTNPGKLSEFRLGFSSLSSDKITLKSLENFENFGEVQETGDTFAANALLKAKFYAKATSLPTVVDDGGFVIPALNGEPGVKSHRWLGREANDDELIAYTLKRVADLPPAKRMASLELVLCFYDPLNKVLLFEKEKITGQIAFEPSHKRVVGFPYRALFKVNPYGKYYDELTIKEHRVVNHRLRAIDKLLKQFTKLYK